MGIKESPLCVFCTNVDTVSHHFSECAECRNFWNVET